MAGTIVISVSYNEGDLGPSEREMKVHPPLPTYLALVEDLSEARSIWNGPVGAKAHPFWFKAYRKVLLLSATFEKGDMPPLTFISCSLRLNFLHLLLLCAPPPTFSIVWTSSKMGMVNCEIVCDQPVWSMNCLAGHPPLYLRFQILHN